MAPAKKKQRSQGSKQAQDNGTTISKIDAMRETLKELGRKAMPLTIKDHLKSKYGIDADTTLISTYKSTLLNKRKRKALKGRREEGRAVATSPAISSEGVTVEDIKAIKEMSERIGVDMVRDLAQVLGKK